MDIEPFYFKNFAFVQSKVSSTTLEELKQEAKFILENSNQFKKYNKDLAGNLEKEYSTYKSKEIPKKKAYYIKTYITFDFLCFHQNNFVSLLFKTLNF